jgi:dephospho-CoA kinase
MTCLRSSSARTSSLTTSAPDSTVPFVGLTGGLGAGKSTALEALRRLGAEVLSTDAVVHELYSSDEVKRAVVDRWGPEMVVDGEVSRPAVAEHVFASPDERAWLEGLLWPLVGQRVWQWRTEVSSREKKPLAAVVETPLLFEAGMEGVYDATVAVIAPEEVRAQRASARGHAAVDERAARQLPQEEKARRATYTVVNDGSVVDLEAKLSDVLEKLSERG